MRASVSSFSFRNNIPRVMSYVNSFSPSFTVPSAVRKLLLILFLCVFDNRMFPIFLHQKSLWWLYSESISCYTIDMVKGERVFESCHFQILEYGIKLVSVKGHSLLCDGKWSFAWCCDSGIRSLSETIEVLPTSGMMEPLVY